MNEEMETVVESSETTEDYGEKVESNEEVSSSVPSDTSSLLSTFSP